MEAANARMRNNNFARSILKSAHHTPVYLRVCKSQRVAEFISVRNLKVKNTNRYFKVKAKPETVESGG